LLGSLIVGSAVALLILSVLLIARSKRAKRVHLLARDSFYNDYSPSEFEHATAELFHRMGYKTKVTAGAGDKGLDVILSKNNDKFGVQCKRYQKHNKIGPNIIREFSGALEGAGLDKGFFNTTSDYTDAAKEAAKNSSFQIELLSGEKLGEIKNRVKDRVNTGLIPKQWWRVMSKWQKGILIVLFFVCVIMIVSSVTYAIVSVVGINSI